MFRPSGENEKWKVCQVRGKNKRAEMFWHLIWKYALPFFQPFFHVNMNYVGIIQLRGLFHHIKLNINAPKYDYSSCACILYVSWKQWARSTQEIIKMFTYTSQSETQSDKYIDGHGMDGNAGTFFHWFRAIIS